VAAQQVGGGGGGESVDDKLSLLDLKAEWQKGTGASLLSTWSDLTEPCESSSWDDYWSGWLGVACDRDGGRVAFISLDDAGVGGPVRAFAPLSALQVLLLGGNIRVTGNVNSLATLIELRELDLSGTSVHGSVESLAELTHLGEVYSFPTPAAVWEARPGALRLGGTSVYGPVFPLRNSTALGEEWGVAAVQTVQAAFIACAAFNQTCTSGVAHNNRTQLCCTANFSEP
jgi:hypothetical protein